VGIATSFEEGGIVNILPGDLVTASIRHGSGSFAWIVRDRHTLLGYEALRHGEFALVLAAGVSEVNGRDVLVLTRSGMIGWAYAESLRHASIEEA
jgi:hypothetical protein